VIVRAYRPADRAAVIELFRAFMQELTTPSLEAGFRAYVERAIREELGRIEDYYGAAFWVADDDGVIGMVGIERHSQDTAEVRRRGVLPAGGLWQGGAEHLRAAKPRAAAL
jgi:hypothetical protein